MGSVQQLLDQPEGGRAWLLGLRHKPYAEAHEALCSLPGEQLQSLACGMYAPTCLQHVLQEQGRPTILMLLGCCQPQHSHCML